VFSIEWVPNSTYVNVGSAQEEGGGRKKERERERQNVFSIEEEGTREEEGALVAPAQKHSL